MHFLINAPDMSGAHVLQDAPVAAADGRYLRHVAEVALRPLSDEQYMQSLAVLLQTFARSSYILDGHLLYWCIEWPPGLLVVQFSPSGEMAWAAVRSPIPDFGGREPLQADIDLSDDDVENHQYNLVFAAWDAQSDEQYRQLRSFKPSDAATSAARDRALEHPNQLGERLEALYPGTRQQWSADCKKRLSEMAGDGVRIGST